MRRWLPLAAWLAVLLVPLPPARGAAPNGRVSAAATLFARAEESFAALKSNASAQRQRHNFTRVLDAYRLVFEKYPATREGEASLLRAGELTTLLFRWTGQEGDLNQAQNYYQRLVQNSPKSRLVDDALLAVAYLYLDHFKDPAQAWLRFRDVTRLAPRGDRTAEAKRQLKRLASYAAVDKPVQAAGPGEGNRPAPPPPGAAVAAARSGVPAGPAAPPVLVAAPPAEVIAMPDPPVIAMPPERGSPRLGTAASPPAGGTAPVLNRVRSIRHWSNPEYSRVVIDLEASTNFYSNLLDDGHESGKPPRLYVDLFSSLVEERFCKPIAVDDGILHGIRIGQYTPDRVRMVLDIDGLRTYRVFPMQNPFRIVVDVTGGAPGAATGTPQATGGAAPTPPTAGAPLTPAAPAVKPARPAPAASSTPAPRPPAVTEAPRYTPEPVPELIPMPTFTAAEAPRPPASPPPPPAAASPAPSPATFSGVAGEAAPPPAPDTKAAPARAARPVAGPPPPRDGISPAGKPSLARQLGLGVRRVVIDAGHGAHDPGAIGVGGLKEKDVTLDLALRVRDILQEAGYETILTRDRDVYLPLEERTAIANTARGDLFLSLHCNSSDAGNLRGVETYFLNLASSQRSMRTAARENSMAVANMSDLQQIVREIQNSKMDESSQFAARVQRSLHDSLHRKFSDILNLGVKQAPFYVLIGAQMPSILAEVSFINHPTEGLRLADPSYRQLIAQALVDGVKRYVRSVKGASVASLGKTTR